MDRAAREWFDRIYDDAASSGVRVPWDRHAPHRHLVGWAERDRLRGDGRQAVVVGCGTGDDAAFVASLGFTTTAFDLAPAAIAAARARFPAAAVEWAVADLLALPVDWLGRFDLVVENQTAQALPADIRPTAITAISRLVAPGGTLLVLANRAIPGQAVEGPPWPLSRAEIGTFASGGLALVSVEELSSNGHPRWRVVYRRS